MSPVTSSELVAEEVWAANDIDRWLATIPSAS